MFSQWATRQVVKFFLKRLLGRILRNNLDLEQLDVQLGWGTVQLKDLVLNTDYFNDQLGASSSLLLKQGSIGSVSAKISWRVLSEDQPCEIEIQDLELVVVPRDKGHVVHKENKDVEAAADVFLVPLAGNEDTSSSIKGTDVAASYSSIQDGVRLVARMVEKVLLGMYVKVTNLVIHLEAQTHEGTSQLATLDPQHLGQSSPGASECKLIIEVCCIEYGLDASVSQAKVATKCTVEKNSTDPTVLVKAVRFMGVTVKLLRLELKEGLLKSSNMDNFVGCSVPLFKGVGSDGLSGSVQLRIPWRGGHMDGPNVNAEVVIQPTRVILSPWKIQQLVRLMESFAIGKKEAGQVTAGGNKESSTGLVGSFPRRMASRDRGEHDVSSDIFVPSYMLISDWMHLRNRSGSQRIQVGVAEEDLAASVDEFFECLDAGSIILSPGRQVEYNVDVRLISIVLELSYKDLGMEGVAITHDKAGELLELSSSELCASLTVSECQTEVCIMLGSMEVTEVMTKNPKKKENHGDTTHDNHNPHYVCHLVEKSLPLFMPLLHYPCATHSGSHNKKLERKRLLRLVPSSNMSLSAKVTLKWQFLHHGADMNGNGVWDTDVAANLELGVVWLDFLTLQRLQLFALELSGLVTGNQGDFGDPGSTESTDQVIKGPVRVSLIASHVRVICCFPQDTQQQQPPGAGLLSSFCGLDLTQPMIKFEQLNSDPPGMSNPSMETLVCSVKEAAFYLISSAAEAAKAQPQDGTVFHAYRVLLIKQGMDNNPVSVEVRWNGTAETGLWISEKAWNAAVVELRRGDSGSDGCNSVFVTATTAQVVEQDTSWHLRHEILSSSSTVIRVNVPIAILHLSNSQHAQLLDLISCILKLQRSVHQEKSGNDDDDKKLGDLKPALQLLEVLQTSISLRCAHVIVVLNVDSPVSVDSAMHSEEKSWDGLHFDIHKLQVLMVSGMGGSNDTSYVTVGHEECEILGRMRKPGVSTPQMEKESLLFACKHNALQRGDGGGGNILASNSAGVTVTYMTWPHKRHLADTLVIANMRGSTFVASNEHIDRISSLISFFDSFKKPECLGGGGGTTPPPPPSGNREKLANIDDQRNKNAENSLRTYFLLDLHDVALYHGPGTKGTDLLKSPPPVACIIAATSVRVSGGKRSKSDSDRFTIRMRDIALHVMDTGLKKPIMVDYTTSSLRQSGYVQVANETLMEVVVQTTSRDKGLKWEIECANNEIRFNTCHDTWSAFVQLLAQLQERFAPPLEQQSVQIKIQRENESSGNESPNLLDGVLEDAFASTQYLRDPEYVDVQSPNISSKEYQEFIEDYVSRDISGDSSSISDDDSFLSLPQEPATSGHQLAPGGGWYGSDVLEFVEDHVPKEILSAKVSLPKKYPPSIGRVLLRNLSVRLRLFSGSDWPTIDGTQKATQFSGRNCNNYLEVFLSGVNLQHDIFPMSGLYASKFLLSVCDFGVYDRSIGAPWRTVIGYHKVMSRPRESSSQAIKIEVDAVHPDPSDALEEYRVSLAFLPIRLHLDQRHVDFCTEFFSPRPSAPPPRDTNLMDEGLYHKHSPNGTLPFALEMSESATEPLLPFFQVCEVLPFTIRVDYLPHRVDLAALRGGNYVELVNLVPWKGIEISMKHVRAAGVHGVSSLTDMVCKEWIQDIFQNQVHKFIQGAGPIRPLYTVGSSAAKLVIFPAQHYWKEYHLLHEIQKGLKRVSSLYKIRKEVMSEERRNGKQNSSTTTLQS